MSQIFSGAITALITPFLNGNVDFKSLGQLVDHQLSHCIDGFVVNGTTAESPTLSQAEVSDIFNFIRTIAGPDFPLILGTGTNSTHDTVKNTQFAKALGADAALTVCPYYNKPTQAGMVAHFTKIAQAVDIPIMLYNVPGRTIVSLSTESIVELSTIKNIIGIKEASGDLAFMKDIEQDTPDTFCVLSGDDSTCYESFAQGGHGVISVMSHILPQETSDWIKSAQAGITSKDAGFDTYATLIEHLFIEPNPTPIKWVLYKMGIIQSCECRLPLMDLTLKGQAALEPLINIHSIAA